MTNNELALVLKSTAKFERKALAKFVAHLGLAIRQEIWKDSDHPNLHPWVTKECGYSNGCAQLRIRAAEAALAVPAVIERLESGALTLTAVHAAQVAIRAEEQRTKSRLPREVKGELMSRIQGHSLPEVMQVIATMFPEYKPRKKEGFEAAAGDRWNLTLDYSSEEKAEFERGRDVLSQTMPNASWSEIALYAMRELMKRKDPLQRHARRKRRASAPGARPTRPTRSGLATERSTQSVKDEVIADANGRCDICGSTHAVQVDHIIPRAHGGTNERANLRALCAKHNRLMAERVGLGR